MSAKRRRRCSPKDAADDVGAVCLPHHTIRRMSSSNTTRLLPMPSSRRPSAARGAQAEWWAVGAAKRAAALNAAATHLESRTEESAALVVREVGKPLLEAVGEVARTVSILRFYAQACFAADGASYPPSMSGLLFARRHPHGVAGLITPWNFPLAIPMWKAAPALAAGNAVLLKPSPDAMSCADLLGDLIGSHVPDGLFTVLPGARPQVQRWSMSPMSCPSPARRWSGATS